MSWNWTINIKEIKSKYGFTEFTLVDKINEKFSKLVLAVQAGYLGLTLLGLKTVEYRSFARNSFWKNKYIGLGLSGTNRNIKEPKYATSVVKFSDPIIDILQCAGVKSGECNMIAVVDGKLFSFISMFFLFYYVIQYIKNILFLLFP